MGLEHEDHAIILFDGVCNFCHRGVQWVIQRDPKGYFRFASLQSPVAEQLLQKYGHKRNLNTVILIEKDQSFTESTAVLKVCRRLSGGWKLFYPLIKVPRVLRDFLYRCFARHRYTLFGKLGQCQLPSQDITDRFLHP